MKRARIMGVLLVMVAVAALLAGCSPQGKASTRALEPLRNDVKLSDYEALSLTASKARDDIKMEQPDLDRLVARVMQKIEEKNATFYKDINPVVVYPKTVQAHVLITKYDRGNSFARFMLAGLGQIHIYAEVTLQDKASQNVLGKYAVNKTFALGGTYGGSVTIDECEDGFCEAVAAIVLGEDR